MFYAAMAGTEASLIGGASAAATESKSSSTSITTQTQAASNLQTTAITANLNLTSEPKQNTNIINNSKSTLTSILTI